MAIDSAEKRKAVSGIGFLPLIPGVTPMAVKDSHWRSESGWSYSGFLAVGGGSPSSSGGHVMWWRAMT